MVKRIFNLKLRITKWYVNVRSSIIIYTTDLNKILEESLCKTSEPNEVKKCIVEIITNSSL